MSGEYELQHLISINTGMVPCKLILLVAYTYSVLYKILVHATCYDCNSFQNKKIKQPCPMTMSEDDCDGCMDGYFEDDADLSVCYRMEMIIGPNGSTIIQEESDASLLCEFNTEVPCIWLKNGREIEIGEYFIWKNNNTGTGTSFLRKDCSLLIQNVSYLDTGVYECSIAITSTSHFSLKSKTKLNVFSKIAATRIENDLHIKSILFDNSNISGLFNTAENWSWTWWLFIFPVVIALFLVLFGTGVFSYFKALIIN